MTIYPRNLKTKKNMQIEGLRGISVIIIVLYHVFYRYQQIYLNNEIVSMQYWGSFGVTLFLIISSYFIGNFHYKNESYLKVIGNKILRLWPCYFLCITITFIITKGFPLPGRTVNFFEYFLNILFINGFVNIAYVDGAHWYLTVLISITIVLYGISHLKISNKMHSYIIWMGVVAVLKVFKFNQLANLIGGSYVGIACIGIAIRNIVEKTSNNKWIQLIFISWIYTGIMLGIGYACILIITIPLFMAVVLKKVKLLENRILVYIGGISYPLYLIHQNISFIIQFYLSKIIGSFNYYYAFISLIVVFVISIIINFYIEKPIQEKIKKLNF